MHRLPDWVLGALGRRPRLKQTETEGELPAPHGADIPAGGKTVDNKVIITS